MVRDKRACMFLRAADTTPPIEFRLDTGFTGHLFAPAAELEGMGWKLTKMGPWKASLADGSTYQTTIYRAVVRWLGREVPVAVLDGPRHLLGFSLLEQTRITLHGTTVVVEPSAATPQGA